MFSIVTSSESERPVVRIRALLLGCCLLLGLWLPAGAAAQSNPPTYEQVISVNPFGILLEFFNAEYERVATESSTLGIGGSFISQKDDDYLNADLFWRFYPSGNPFEGWAFGAKAGLTNIPDHGTFAGVGFDLNRSWLLGKNENFSVGAGFGLKRLFGADDEELSLKIIPTIRIVNIGFAF